MISCSLSTHIRQESFSPIGINLNPIMYKDMFD